MKTNVIITIDKQYLDNLEGVVSIMKGHGLQVHTVKHYGVITGSLDESRIHDLEHLKEISSVEKDHYTRYIPPPDAEIQ